MDEDPFAVMWPDEAVSGGGAVASDLPVSSARPCIANGLGCPRKVVSRCPCCQRRFLQGASYARRSLGHVSVEQKIEGS